MQTLSLTKVLRSCGHAVLVVCYFEHEESMIVEFQETGAEVILLDWSRKRGFIRFLSGLSKKIRAIKPDIVHVQYMAPGALPILAARLAGVKTVFATVHQPYTKSHGRSAKMILRTASFLATKLIAVSQSAEKSWFGTSGLFDENKPLNLQPHHFTIYNSVDTDRIQEILKNTGTEALKEQLKIPSGAPLIGTVSRLRFEKGIDILVEAFGRLISEGENVHLLIAGNGPDEKKLRDQAVKLNISDRITFYGAADRENAIRLLSIMDIVVVPSRFEGFGLTAAEAMAAGKPVVASDCYGLKELIINEETGFIFPVNDFQALKNKLESLVNNPTLRKQIGNAGKERVSSHFSQQLFRKKIKALYGI